MNKLTVFDVTGKETGDVTIDNELLTLERGQQAVKDTVVSFMNSLRAGTACTKTRGEVAGSGRKPWKQKGSGRARVGSVRTPVWRGGGTVFGPLGNRNYTKKVNKKVRTLAFQRAFSERLNEGAVVVVDELKLADFKTKQAIQLLNDLKVGQDALIIVDQYEPNLLIATNNLPTVEVLTAEVVNVYQLLVFKKLVITKAALAQIESRLKGVNIYE